MKLAEIQALFYRLVTGAPNVRPEEAESCFLGSPALSATERVEIYANMYRWRLFDALREDFPKLAAVMDDDAFCDLCERYVKAHPSEHPDLGRLGRHLVRFIRAQSDLGRSDLADLAALEWARAEVFFEAPTSVIGMDVLASLGERFVGARLELIPALRIFRLDHDVMRLWRCLDEEQPPEPPLPGPTALAVWRPGLEVFHTSLELDEALALERVAAGLPLSDVCAAFEGRAEPANVAFAALASWINEGWIAAMDAPSECRCGTQCRQP